MPRCSRCTRLGIPCIGSGERRYKFMPAGPDRNTSQPTTSSAAQAESSSPAGSSMPRAPSNQATLDASHFVSALQVTDVCFDLRIYGPFFTDLPRRLGRNRALDASVRALTTSFPSVRTHRCTLDMYKAYGEALGCLRASLDDPATAGSVETLCAVYLVMICQVRTFLAQLLLPGLVNLLATRVGSAGAVTFTPITARPSPTCSTQRRQLRTGGVSLKPR